MHSTPKLPNNLSANAFGQCPIFSGMQNAMGHSITQSTVLYLCNTVILNAYPHEEDFFISSANPGYMTDVDVRNIWLNIAAKMNSNSLDKLLISVVSSNESYLAWS